MDNLGLNGLLKWGVQNSSNGGDGTGPPSEPSRGLDQEALARLLGGPSDADRMREAMAAVESPELDLENKMIAFDNFEQLIENLDNANNMENMKLWVPLVNQLDNEESELQRMAAWCVGTAVQNNARSQERCLVVGAIPKLVKLFLQGKTTALKKKAVFAISSEVRNYQPALDALVDELPSAYRGKDKLDAADMDAVDTIINRLREAIK